MPNKTPNITLDDIIKINVEVSPVSSFRRTLDSALFLSEKKVAVDRVVEINGLEELIALGYETNSPEYMAIQLYFEQSPTPAKAYLGWRSTETAEPESYIDAVTACRNSSYEWYALIIVDSLVNKMTDYEIISVCDYIESASPESICCLNITNERGTFEFLTEDKREETGEEDAHVGLLTALAERNYQRTFVQYDENEANRNKTAISGIVGYALGYNKNLSKSFTLAYKTVRGIASLKTTSDKLRTCLDKNINVYVNQGYYYNLFRQGTMLNGDRFDEVYYIDMLVNDLRTDLMSALISNPKIPQTNAGVNILTSVISVVLDKYVDIEFIQSGVWSGNSVKSLKHGDTLPKGYLVLFDDINSQSGMDRVNRVAPNCYVCCKLAGAIEYIVLGINVSR